MSEWNEEKLQINCLFIDVQDEMFVKKASGNASIDVDTFFEGKHNEDLDTSIF